MPSPLPTLNTHLKRIASIRQAGPRRQAFAALAAEAEEAGAVGDILERLRSQGTNGERFAMELAATLTGPVPASLIEPLSRLVEQHRFPSRLRIAVAARIIQTDTSTSARFVEAFVHEVSPRRGLRRLKRLAALVPDDPDVRESVTELKAGAPRACPRCGIRLGPDELAAHLWERHRLLFENGRVREPWDLIGHWVNEFIRTSRADFFDRCCELAQALDAARGLSRVHRLLLLGGHADDEEAHALLRAEARAEHATLCPHCFAHVPQPTQSPPEPVLLGSGEMQGGEWRVRVEDAYAVHHLSIRAGDLNVFSGLEPGNALTRRGAMILLLVPLLAAAALFALLPPILGIAPAVPTAMVLVAATFAYIGIVLTWRTASDPTDRVLNHTWRRLVPTVAAGEMGRKEAAFVAGLAVASRHRGDGLTRAESLAVADRALRDSGVGRTYLTPLGVLRIDDAVAAGADDLPLIADEVSGAFAGELPLDHADVLVRQLRGDPVDRTRRARLRVLILAKAFAAGLEAEDLRTIGQLCPTLGVSFASEDRDGLARLRLLWLYRPRRLWQRVGAATTVFDLARYPQLAANYLRLRPDLLLFQASAGGDGASPILICEEGVVFRNAVITDRATRIAASNIRGGYELTVGDQSFRFRDDPALLARRLRAWTAFLFDEFLPRARAVARRRSPAGDRLMRQKRTTCTECGQAFLGLIGEIGLTEVPPATEGVA